MHSRYTLLYIWCALFLLVLTVTACSGNTIYHHFEHLSNDGWQRNDTVYFEVPKMMIDGNYGMTFDLRIDSDYPYSSLSVIVEQTLLPLQTTRRDTVDCRLTDEKGNHLGPGVSQFQYHMPVSVQNVHEGQSLRVAVFHNMKREELPGVCDVGIQMKKLK